MTNGDAQIYSTPPFLAPNIAQGRFGVAYVQTLCAQAGFGHIPTPPDEDVAAIDGQVRFLVGSCAYQVKCTTRNFTKSGTLRWSVSERELTRWRQAGMDVYFIVVRVDKQQDSWANHVKSETVLQSAAYWVKVDTTKSFKSISVSESQRLTAEALHEWAQTTSEAFGVAA